MLIAALVVITNYAQDQLIQRIEKSVRNASKSESSSRHFTGRIISFSSQQLYSSCQLSFSVVQKVVHPLSRGLGRLRIDMSTGNTGVW